jgi:F0F1-type ATP synthase membrane subunit c/vacuolar-type H+-ATPase subunit K
MDRNLALLLIFTIGILGPCWVFVICGRSSINALGRNPSAAPRIFTAMTIILVLAMAVSLIAMLVAFQLFT